MKYRKLGRSGLDVSTLCLGTMTFGEADAQSFMHQVGCDEATSHAILDRAVAAGVNFLDTADIYGQDGLSERVIGRWLVQPGHRDRVVLATKFRFRTGPGPNGTGASRKRVMRCCEDSLKRLQTDHIDLYQIHMQDREVPEDELLRALDDLVTQGKVLYVGCSNYAAYRLMDSLWRADTQGRSRFVSMQMQYSLLIRDIEREHTPIAVEQGVGILPWSPLAGGFLSGKYDRGARPDGSRLAKWSDAWSRFDNARGWGTIDALRAVAAEVGATPAQVALAWLLHRPGVTSVIFGARSVAQLDDNLPAADLELTADQVYRLEIASGFEHGYPYDFIRRVQQSW
ncbi:MAG TPA: aldo/keto reductase [Myxococcota bacterium]|nr:aldo/keto reductase [Myxococcota bacterium]